MKRFTLKFEVSYKEKNMLIYQIRFLNNPTENKTHITR